MGFYKKTIFLKNTNATGMALLTIEKTNGGIFGTLKSYDLPSCEDMILGISINGKGVIKQSIFFGNDNIYTFKLSNNFDIDANIGCVLVQNLPKTVKPLVWGSNNGKSRFKEDIIDILNEEKKPSNEIVDKAKDDIKINVEKLHNIEPQDFVKEKDDDEQLKTRAEENTHLYEDTPEDIEKLIDEEMDEGNFYELIKEQIDDLFARFPRNETLESIVDNSKWVTINYDDVQNDYVVGLLYDEEGKLEFVAYGVPGNIDNQPPSQIIEYSQWLPLDPKKPNEEGYWVMFQDAMTGDSVRLRVQEIS